MRSDLRVTRRNTEDLNDNFDISRHLREDVSSPFLFGLPQCETRINYSHNENNQYILLPHRKYLLDYSSKKISRKYLITLKEKQMKVYAIHTSRQYLYCFRFQQLKQFSKIKGFYTIRGFVFDKKVLPRFLDPGTYRFDVTIYEKSSDDINSKLIYFGRLY